MFRATKQEDLVQINDFVHDWTFDLDKIRTDKVNSSLDIEFTREMFDDRTVKSGWVIKQIRVPIVKCILRIHKIITHEIIDTEQIGLYPFESIEYDLSSKIVHVKTVVPLEFRVWVEDLEISANRDEVPADFKMIG